MHIFSNSTRCVDKPVYISLSNYSEKKKVGILASGKVKYPDVYLLFSLRYQPLKSVKKVLKKKARIGPDRVRCSRMNLNIMFRAGNSEMGIMKNSIWNERLSSYKFFNNFF